MFVNDDRTKLVLTNVNIDTFLNKVYREKKGAMHVSAPSSESLTELTPIQVKVDQEVTISNLSGQKVNLSKGAEVTLKPVNNSVHIGNLYATDFEKVE